MQGVDVPRQASAHSLPPVQWESGREEAVGTGRLQERDGKLEGRQVL